MSDPQTNSAEVQASSHPGWQGILDADEQILWQGQPDQRFRVEFESLREVLPGLLFVTFALFWMVQAAQASWFFAMFGLIFVVIGLRQIFQPVLWSAYLRTRSWYTLTDRRAIVATDVPFKGRRLTSYPIDHATLVEYAAGDPPSILFGPDRGKRSERPGFRYISDSDTVMGLIRGIQQRSLPTEGKDEA
ncbi:MAG: aspartate carbamoyltransferase catalytic subunit [Paracoccus denitrificans]|uniref:Aspartate carbamoyltransferase catalytic subunit n=1 Tax=Paracoccus denitrificans TaxID=266 RepID=A0A533IB26_PARDE|nr:MAG: aspartate carbamoyltransferase catalytic subunit [Paracoccus denitrificans]